MVSRAGIRSRAVSLMWCHHFYVTSSHQKCPAPSRSTPKSSSPGEKRRLHNSRHGGWVSSPTAQEACLLSVAFPRTNSLKGSKSHCKSLDTWHMCFTWTLHGTQGTQTQKGKWGGLGHSVFCTPAATLSIRSPMQHRVQSCYLPCNPFWWHSRRGISVVGHCKGTQSTSELSSSSFLIPSCPSPTSLMTANSLVPGSLMAWQPSSQILLALLSTADPWRKLPATLGLGQRTSLPLEDVNWIQPAGPLDPLAHLEAISGEYYLCRSQFWFI